jgi:23S rRNA (uracil1939-C5)-methyltransferase
VNVVSVRGIATGGDGVCRLPDGMTAFVPRTAPGDVVEVTVTERHRRWARARIQRVVEPGPDRTTPGCPHYDADECGGCQLQHLTMDAQAAAKQGIVRDVLSRVGGRTVQLPPLAAAPSPWRYRSKISLAAGGGRLGFHRYDRPGEVFAVNDCLVAVPELMALLDGVRAALSGLPAGVTHVVLRLDRAGGGHVVVRGGTPPWDAAGFAAAVGGATPTIWWEPEGGAVRAVTGDRGAFPALAFQQVNPPVANQIRRDAVAWLAAEPGAVAWDLYGGVGEAARLMAGAGAQVWSVDADRSAVAWAERQPADGAAVPTLLAGRVEEVLHRLPTPDVVLLNPPRQGADRRVTATLERLRAAGHVRRLAYMSCDPATLARDLARLPGYALMSVAAYDMFPQTAHVETLALLEAA